MKNKIRIYAILLLIFFSGYGLLAQTNSTIVKRKNIISINLISLPPLFNNLNQKWVGLEYQRIINNKLSLSIATYIGIFEDYTFTKYHDFFDEGQGFSYTRENVRMPGYHIIPSIRYELFRPIKKTSFAIYVTAKLDYYQYFMKKEIYESYTNNTESSRNMTYRFNIGGGVGAQYIAFERLSVDLNISLFTKIFSKSTSNQIPELYPENSFWKNANNSNWATINLMLGYAFGNKSNNN